MTLEPVTPMTLAQLDALQREITQQRIAVQQEKLSCPEGGRHDWQYRGREAQLYRCMKCGGSVTKSELRELTNGA